MTESDWLSSLDPAAMLELYKSDNMPWPRGQPAPVVSDRKLRLFACAWWRSILPHSPNQEAYVQGVEDGEMDYEWMLDKYGPCYQGCDQAHLQRGAALLHDIIGNPFRPVLLPWRCRECGIPCGPPAAGYYCSKCGADEARRPWLTMTVLAIARRIYDERDFAGMPILADALEDAGCDNEEILRHCRGEELIPSPHMPKIGLWGKLRGPHVRGCWCLDLILGKE